MKRTFTVNTWIGDGIHATVTFNYYAGRPGVYSGPPEKCYEDEPDDLEVISVVVGGSETELSESDREELEGRLYETAFDLIEGEMIEASERFA